MAYSSAYAPPAPPPQGGEERVDLVLLPSPPWGRGWTATGAFTSRGGPGEGVTQEQIEKQFSETH